MNFAEFRDLLCERAHDAGQAPSDQVVAQLFRFFELLRRWNQTINLTALPLEAPTAETFDRLLVEPLRVAEQLPDSLEHWFDLGSGGGSPAIPIKLARPELRLTMIEARERKAAFLREAVRELGLRDVQVEAIRFEALLARPELRQTIDLVTVRAVRMDESFLEICRFLLRDGGWLAPLGFTGDDLSGFSRDARSGAFQRTCST